MAADAAAPAEIKDDDNITDKLKVVMLGNSKTGKTSILQALAGQPFQEEMASTVGIDSRDHTLKVKNRLYKLQIWDSAGMERFHSISQSVCRDCDGVILVYSTIEAKSFKYVEYWLQNIPSLPVMIVGNKNDIQPPLLKVEDMDNFAAERGCGHILTSAKSNAGITEAFSKLITRIVDDPDAEYRKNSLEGAFKLTDSTYMPSSQSMMTASGTKLCSDKLKLYF